MKRRTETTHTHTMARVMSHDMIFELFCQRRVTPSLPFRCMKHDIYFVYANDQSKAHNPRMEGIKVISGGE